MQPEAQPHHVVLICRDTAEAQNLESQLRSLPRWEFTIHHARSFPEAVAHLQSNPCTETEERFRLFSEATNDALWDWDLVTDSVWWNEGVQRLFGYLPDEIATNSKGWLSHIHPEDQDSILSGIDRAIADGDTDWSANYRFRRRDGSFAYVFDRGKIIRDASGRAFRMIGGVMDTTELRLSQQRLQEQATLLDKAQDAIIVRDLEHRIVFWNLGAERLYGWTKKEAIGSFAFDRLYLDPDAFHTATRELLENGDWSGQLTQVSKSGEEIVVEARWTLVKDENGQPTSILAINTDITLRKRLEQEFLRAQRLESIGTLAGGIAHDLNNVLAPIMMSIDLLEMRTTDSRSKELLKTIGSSAKRGAEMVHQILSFARGMEGNRIEIQLKHLIDELEKIVRDTFPKNVRVKIRIDKQLRTVIGDPTQLHQLLLNLCVNSRDAMPQGGELRISAENIDFDDHYASMNVEADSGPYVKIEVEDTGSGIPRENMERIFDPFFTTKGVGKGTGLGLPTCMTIVKSHNGFMRVYSEPDVGTKFFIYLPGSTQTSMDGSRSPMASLLRGNGETILVVDDEASVLQVTKHTLEAFGYRVLAATDGAEAVSVFASRMEEISLVLTDMVMPVMDGSATIRVLRRLKPDVRIIAASGFQADGQISFRPDGKAEHFISKPYTAEILLSLVHRLLNENANPPPPA